MSIAALLGVNSLALLGAAAVLLGAAGLGQVLIILAARLRG